MTNTVVYELRSRLTQLYDTYHDQQELLQTLMDSIPATDPKCVRLAIEMAKQEGRIESMISVLRLMESCN